MKKLAIILSMALICAGFSTPLLADTIGYIDMQQIFQSYKGAKEAQDQLKKEQEKYAQLVKEKQEAIEKAKKAGKPNKDIEAMIEKAEKELKPTQEKLMGFNQQLSEQLKSTILGAIAKVSKEYGVDVVLDKQVILTGGFNLTPFVLDKLNTPAATETPAAPAPAAKPAKK